MNNNLFTPFKLGPIELRNRTIRSAAFENMCKDNSPTAELENYHVSVARGGIGMTTVAYAAVNRSGLSFNGQLWMRPAIVEGLKKMTDKIHQQGAKASIQLGHCGNMTHKGTCGQIPVGASSGFNLYSPTIVRGLKKEEIKQLVKDFGAAVELSRQAGFDCVEIHAGHGYLISQFLSPYTNKRKDEYGGSLENRMRFMDEVITEVKSVAADNIAVVVKMNMYDGFKSGMHYDETIQVAKRLEERGVDALVLSAGFVSKAPMVVMHGAMPLKTLRYYMNPWKYWWLKMSLALVGRIVIPTVPYQDTFFLEDAKRFRAELKLPLIYVGGVCSREDADKVLDAGFELIQMARVLVNDTDFVNKLAQEENYKSPCGHSNYCIGRMYTLDMKCHHCVENLPKSLQREVAKQEEQVNEWNK